MNSNYRITAAVTDALFIIIIVMGLLYSIGWRSEISNRVIEDIKDIGIEGTIRNVESTFNTHFSSCAFFRDMFSIIQRMLDKHEVRNFEVIRSNNDFLYFQKNPWPCDTPSLIRVAEQLRVVNNATQSYGGEMLFVQIPYKNPDRVDELKYYTADETEVAEDKLLELLESNGINYLDLRKHDECSEMYRTDHHWTVRSAFNSAFVISEFIANDNRIKLGNYEYYANPENYNIINYEDSFLGSLGIKVGQYYVGKDDFAIYNPEFKTDMEFSHYVDGKLETYNRGDFWHAFVDETILMDTKYNNKNVSLLYDSDHEVRIVNHHAENDYRVLLISHSYGRPLSMYMSLYFKELMYLDPQQGRYNDSIVRYIECHKPDVVIMAYNDFINVDD